MFIPLPLCSLPFQYSHGSRWGCLLSPAIDTWLGSWVRPMKVCKVLVPYHMICFTFLNQVAVPKLKNWPWKKPIHLSVSAQYSEKSILPLQNVSYWFNSLNYAGPPHSLRELCVRTTAQDPSLTRDAQGGCRPPLLSFLSVPFCDALFRPLFSRVSSSRIECCALLGESIMAAFYAGWWFNHLNWSCWWGLWFWDWRPEVQ